MRLLERRLVLKLLTLIVCCLGASYSFADSNLGASEEGIKELAATVSALEKRVSALEESSAQKPAVSENSKTELGWKSKSNWRLLKKDMTKMQVKNLLGDPDKIDVSGPFENWHWNGLSGPKISFYHEKLDEWDEPN